MGLLVSHVSFSVIQTCTGLPHLALMCKAGSQVAERLENRAINQKVAGSIPGRVKLCCVLGQGTSPLLPLYLLLVGLDKSIC